MKVQCTEFVAVKCSFNFTKPCAEAHSQATFCMATILSRHVACGVHTRFRACLRMLSSQCCERGRTKCVVLLGFAWWLVSMQPKLAAQNTSFAKRDSLRAAITLLANDSTKVDALSALALAYNAVSPDSTMLFAREALTLARTLKYQHGIAEAERIYGFAEQRRGSMAQAMTHYLEALPIFESLRDTLGMGNCYNGMGIVNFEQGHFAQALEYYTKAYYMFVAARAAERIVASLSNKSYVFIQQNRLDSAMVYAERARASEQEYSSKETSPFILVNYGEIARRTSNFSKAQQYGEQALQSSRRLGNRVSETRALNLLGGIFFDKGSYTEAERYLQEALRVATGSSLRYRVKDGYEYLTALYVKTGDYRQAYRYRVLAEALQDSLDNEEIAVRVATLEARREAEQRKAEIALLTKNNEIQRTVLVALVIGLVIVSGFSVVVVRYSRRLKASNIQISQQRDLLEHQAQEISAVNTQLAARNAELDEINQELAETNERLSEANEFRTRMLSIVSHDLKNPLTAIIGFADVIKFEHAPDSPTFIYASRIGETGWRMISLVKDLLDHAARDMGKMELFIDKVDAAALLKDVIVEYTPKAQDKEQHIVVSLPESCIIDADAKRLRQVIENLLSNAVKYSERGKTIRVAIDAQSRSDVLRFTVQDEGPGFTEADKKKMFGFFQKLSAHPTGGESSTGVGLAIVKHIVELHGGCITVESAARQGSTFIVELPREISQREPNTANVQQV